MRIRKSRSARLLLLPALMVSMVFLFAPSIASAAVSTVHEPAFGLPHIYADTDAEAARADGLEDGRDRLGQLILFARVARGTLAQAFGLLDPGAINDDIETRREGYTSSELNRMFATMPEPLPTLILEYCKGVNDAIEEIYAGTAPKTIEVFLLQTLGFTNDLFGNATIISDQLDPNYLAPGGADPERPNGGFQYTPEMAVSIIVLQIRSFGIESFGELSRLSELQGLIGVHGTTTGTEMWDDRNFLNDPLAPVTVPDSTTPGFGGPLAFVRNHTLLASVANRFPRFDYAAAALRREQAHEARVERARRWGAWPQLGSYAWMIGGGKSATGNPWLGGFPQMGIQTPSIMQFLEMRSGEGADHQIEAVGFELVGMPSIIIGHTDSVAWTSTTAQLRTDDTFLEEIVGEDNDNVRYNDEGAPVSLVQRTETFRTAPVVTKVFWRSHERAGNGGSRPITDFMGDAEGKAESGTANSLVDSDASFGGSLVGGHVLITDGTGAGQIREISAVPSGVELQVTTAWTVPPAAGSVYVAVESGNSIAAAARDSVAWLEETTSAVGWSQFQRAENVLDIRAGTRALPTTHNFYAVDNKPFNSIGTQSGTGDGNLGYYSGGFSRIRQGADSRLPLDGTVSNPLVLLSGTVDSSTETTLTANAGVFTQDLSPEPLNYRYQNPTELGSDFIVTITSGTGYKQTRRIASNTADTLTVELEWGVNPANGDTFAVYEIAGMPEVINPAEEYTANWNNKAATADEGDNFGREFRHLFILERLAAENLWDRDKQRQLNKDVAGVDGSGTLGRFLIPRLREAVDGVGNGGNPDVDTVLAALEAHAASPDFGRHLNDPVSDTTDAGEIAFLWDLINQLAQDIYGDEYAGAISVPGGSRGLNIATHAIDSAAGDVPGSYIQAYSGNYFNGSDWRVVVRDSLSTLATVGIPPDSPRGFDTFAHALAGLFSALVFEPVPVGNRGTYEQIVEVRPPGEGGLKGEFIFPLGQSGMIEGSIAGVTSISPHMDSLQPVWRDWRFVPMLQVAKDLQAGNADGDGDGVFDAYERWYYGDTSPKATDTTDEDKASLLDEFLAGTDPTDIDTDDDGVIDHLDSVGQDRLRSGLLKLSGKIKQPTSDKDRLILTAKTGRLSDDFDPPTTDITVTVRDGDGEIYTVTIPAGTMEVNPNGRVFKYKDKAGTLDDLYLAVLRKSGSPKGKSILKIKTIVTDFSHVDMTNHDVEVELNFGSHTMVDSRLWEVKGSVLKASK